MKQIIMENKKPILFSVFLLVFALFIVGLTSNVTAAIQTSGPATVYEDKASGTKITIELVGIKGDMKITYEKTAGKNQCKESTTIKEPRGNKSPVIKVKCNGAEYYLQIISNVWTPRLKNPGWSDFKTLPRASSNEIPGDVEEAVTIEEID